MVSHGGINDDHAPLVHLIQSPCCFCCSAFHWSSWNWWWKSGWVPFPSQLPPRPSTRLGWVGTPYLAHALLGVCIKCAMTLCEWAGCPVCQFSAMFLSCICHHLPQSALVTVRLEALSCAVRINQAYVHRLLWSPRAYCKSFCTLDCIQCFCNWVEFIHMPVPHKSESCREGKLTQDTSTLEVILAS